ncbi:DEAD/DEAH box helicase [Capnocytophaga catalasegens]|uniref:DEAD/DEAH box helicase n=1 Tax=Capnocytophaga catalasegens TaxID=1004260 RepID=A0AAV5AXE0_9FLAO|nr:DEAD/DEAH box helicase [Capnocytophaga catalasegens]GIZ16547.1 DEAD/DEAH box helicase [Capnocytophaga catalasegens]GJM51379.1 DEAD/DEAH box helicase [Capnocytophaga catalasegens]GJM54283.1 DEAD/DEAH box helicase [Capnocytophaga catalasegens]
MNLFNELGLEEPILKAITDLGFERPSEVQQATIPVLLSTPTDIVSLAQTGTGKTAAFGFPLLQNINPDNKQTQGLILAPTRELCLQITNEMKLYGKYLPKINIVAIYGGASIEEQAKNVKKGAQIIVATPGRMQDMIRRNFVNISNINYCILDEADEMLNMGFYEDITAILQHTPSSKYTWLFSATMPNEVAKIAREFMNKPKEITIGSRNQGSNNVQHEYYVVNGRHRYEALKRLADANPDIFSVVFCRTKRDTQSVAEKLIEDGYNAAALHGDLSQNQRDLVMKGFRSRQIQMLVATDVAARGIDVDDVTHVIHYQLPDEIETYTHRSGRTGRAGKSGISMVILAKSEVKKIKTIEKIIRKEFESKQIPSGIEICEIQLYHLANTIKNAQVNTAIDDYLPAIKDVLQELDREELIKRMVAVEFNRFYNYYKNSKDLNEKNSYNKSYKNDEGETRYFINIGEKDGYDWRTLKDFLRATLNLDKEDIFKVDVKNTFSFFNTDADKTDDVLAIFNDFKMNGRFINVEISQKSEKNSSKREKNKSKSFKEQKSSKRNKKSSFGTEKSSRKRKRKK